MSERLSGSETRDESVHQERFLSLTNSNETSYPNQNHTPFRVALMSGACAGLTVDSILFPLDTIKTRLQYGNGKEVFRGGFKALYHGIGPYLASSAPAAALFFGAYETTKNTISHSTGSETGPLGHMVAASMGEISASSFRVPFEVVKQQLQAGLHTNSFDCVRAILRTRGFIGLYTGFVSQVFREIPFDMIQFSLYEYFKLKRAEQRSISTNQHVTVASLPAFEGMLCGCLAGCIAAAVTTPLDVVKTRLMTQHQGRQYSGIRDCFRRIIQDEGFLKLYSGIGPRVLWISLGGAIFFGAYEQTKRLCMPSRQRPDSAWSV
eukprot:TRINITY_DN11977_c0_g1::TRINITY_DN11977_c0_g1_i1::g.16926::m.16926 TRINITY_DN11977_c0_g1::TRINITY_DN11977_c0_g1_i1::g.16926  ORF type:complete len:321 (-),score=0.70,sp/Q94AG6/SAMC1_ARATH/41.40/3e-70,Mito_carr/PF00153.22/1.1e-14,Mito_carr/PF00153.22/1.1e-16,Mito_carr/PF00153.22/4e-29 TRINITY_DN11977_c0_g1_i1:464-1426(-)